MAKRGPTKNERARAKAVRVIQDRATAPLRAAMPFIPIPAVCENGHLFVANELLGAAASKVRYRTAKLSCPICEAQAITSDGEYSMVSGIVGTIKSADADDVTAARQLLRQTAQAASEKPFTEADLNDLAERLAAQAPTAVELATILRDEIWESSEAAVAVVLQLLDHVAK